MEKPDKLNFIWIILAYFAASLGGFLGLLFGNIIWKSKKTLPTGDKIPRYSEPNRKHGENITYISIKVLIIIGIARIFLYYQQ